jgi:hypothetical protein
MMNGTGDGTDWDIDVDITEEEIERLKKAKNSGKDFQDCEEVADLYDRLYDLANESATEDLIDNDEEFQEYYEEDETTTASDFYSISVEYPYF